jgi:hypothetical protein
MSDYPLGDDSGDERRRKKRRNRSINPKAFYGSLETFTEKFLKEGRTEEEIKEMACNKIEETTARFESGVEPEVRKAVYNIIHKGSEREDINEQVLEAKMTHIMGKFEK